MNVDTNIFSHITQEGLLCCTLLRQVMVMTFPVFQQCSKLEYFSQ